MLALVALASSGPLACATRPEACGGSGLSPERLHAEQRGLLATLHYAGGPLPPEPSEAELATLPARLDAADPDEVAVLRACYGDERDLLVYATRDSDADGIPDYRVSEDYGKLHEGDLDLDGDGVANVLDAAPYDPDRAGRDENGNAVPDHVDWSLQGRAEDASRQQQELFARHGILLVDRSARFDDTLARSAWDVLTRVFRAPLAEPGALSALSVIATEETCLLAPEVDDETNGLFVPQTRSLTIYRVGLDAEPFVQLGLLTHELGHAWQYSIDDDASDRDAENRRTWHAAPGFHAEVAAFGWSVDQQPSDEERAGPVLFASHFLEGDPSYRYRDRTPFEWAEWLQALFEERGDDYLADPRVAEAGIVGDYSTENPWEWHSDQLIAYLFDALERTVVADPARAAERDALVARMRAWSLDAWPAFRHANLSAPVRRHLAERFPIAPGDLEHLVDVYVASDRSSAGSREPR